MHFQGLTKYLVLIYYAEQIYDKVSIVKNIYVSNRASSKQAYAILLRWSQYCLMFAKYGRIPVVGGIVFIILWPYLVYTQTGVLDFITPLYIPFVSDETTIGLCIMHTYHILLMLLGVFGTCGADFMIVVLVLHLWPMCLIWDGMFEELNVAVRQEGAQSDMRAVKVHLRNIILLHKEMCKYVH